MQTIKSEILKKPVNDTWNNCHFVKENDWHLLVLHITHGVENPVYRCIRRQVSWHIDTLEYFL